MNAPVMQTSVENTIEQPQLPKSNNQSNEMIVVIRPSFMKFCQDGCRAAALNHILYWIAQKAKGQPVEGIQKGEVSWYGSNEEITESLLAWGGCKVRIEVNHLISMGLLGQSRGHKWGSGNRAKHFIFSKEHCAALLDTCQEHGINILQIGLCDTVLRLIQSTTTNEVMIAAIQKMLTSSKSREIPSHTSSRFRESHPLDLETLSSNFRGSKTKDYTKVSNKDIQREREVTSPEEIHSFTPSELCLLKWIEEKHINIAKSEATVKTQLEKIAPLAETKAGLQSLIETARQIYPNVNDLSLGNLVNKRVLNAHAQQNEWDATNQPENAPQDETEGVTTDTVIWTRRPEEAFSNGPIKLKSYIELFERMSEEDAEKYGYGYYPGLSFDELDRIKNYLARGK